MDISQSESAKTRYVDQRIGGQIIRYDRILDTISVGKRTNKNSKVYTRTPRGPSYDTCIEVTTRCTFKCVNCFSASSPDSVSREMHFESIKEIIQKRVPTKIRISVTGGEPCLHSSISNILELPSLFPTLNFVISTNGNNIKTSHIRILSRNDWLVAVSLHGRRNMHNAYSGADCYDRIRQSVQRLSGTVRLHLYSMLHATTKRSDIDHLFDIQRTYNIDFLRFCVPRPYGRYHLFKNRRILDYIMKHTNERVGVKMTASNTEFITVNGLVRMSN